MMHSRALMNTPRSRTQIAGARWCDYRLAGDAFPPRVVFKVYVSRAASSVVYFSGKRVIKAGSHVRLPAIDCQPHHACSHPYMPSTLLRAVLSSTDSGCDCMGACHTVMIWPCAVCTRGMHECAPLCREKCLVGSWQRLVAASSGACGSAHVPETALLSHCQLHCCFGFVALTILLRPRAVGCRGRSKTDGPATVLGADGRR